VRILLQYGTERLAVLKDVPTVVELASNDIDKALLRFYALKFNMARPIFTPPDVPADRLAALQAAFEATMKDEKYLADARKIGLETNWLGSKELTAQVRQIEDTPQAVVDRLRELLAKAAK
jgi:tripartite-type tricarboxylate transporter receptor subunit TctC